MNNKTDQFKKLHQQSEPLLIGNVWNAQSARVLEKLKFQALATSSAAVAETLGYNDGEQMSFEEYMFVITRIKKGTDLPLSVDMESGYGSSVEEIIKNLKRLYETGIAGINIEDSSIKNGKREISEAESFAEKLKLLMLALRADNIDLFINVRTDAFLLGLSNARSEAIRRIKLYDSTGVHGLFLPCITDIEDIKATVNETNLPINVMCMPGLPDFQKLRSAGVKRISMGNFLNSYLYKEMEKKCEEINSGKNFATLFNY